MNSENFEKYLILLKGLLNLSETQKDEIALELRDHLEDRIEQLTRDGKTADEAEWIAIKEFGDAAGMASSFINVSRLKRRRWMMRFTTLTIAGSFLVAVCVMSMWPQNGPVQIATSHAQEEAKSNSNAPKALGVKKVNKRQTTQSIVSKTRTMFEEQAIQTLGEEVAEFTAVDLPLFDAIRLLSKDVGVPIIVSRTFLDENGVDADSVISLSIQNAKLTTILDLIISDQLGISDWAYGVKDSFIFVSNEDAIEDLMEVRVYECSDFAVLATVQLPLYHGMGGYGGGGPVGGHGGGGGGFFCIPATLTGIHPQGLGGQGGGFGGGGGGLGGQTGPKPEIVQGGTQNVQTKEKQKTDSKKDAENSLSFGFKTYQTQDLSELIDCMRLTVDPESWDELGGAATLNQVGTALVVKQSLKNHEQIEELLMMLRKAKN